MWYDMSMCHVLNKNQGLLYSVAFIYVSLWQIAEQHVLVIADVSPCLPDDEGMWRSSELPLAQLTQDQRYGFQCIYIILVRRVLESCIIIIASI